MGPVMGLVMKIQEIKLKGTFHVTFQVTLKELSLKVGDFFSSPNLKGEVKKILEGYEEFEVGYKETHTNYHCVVEIEGQGKLNLTKDPISGSLFLVSGETEQEDGLFSPDKEAVLVEGPLKGLKFGFFEDAFDFMQNHGSITLKEDFIKVLEELS